MDILICFIIGFLLAQLFNYIERKKKIGSINTPKTLNIGNSNDIIKVTPGMLMFEVNSPSNIHNFNLKKMDNVIFYVSSTNSYILYKDKDFRYVKLDIPLK